MDKGAWQASLWGCKGSDMAEQLTHTHTLYRASPWLSDKEFACNAGGAGDAGLIPGWGRSPGGGNGNPLQCCCL